MQKVSPTKRGCLRKMFPNNISFFSPSKILTQRQKTFLCVIQCETIYRCDLLYNRCKKDTESYDCHRGDTYPSNTTSDQWRICVLKRVGRILSRVHVCYQNESGTPQSAPDSPGSWLGQMRHCSGWILLTARPVLSPVHFKFVKLIPKKC